MNEIGISVVVPVYKVPENYLRKCIESIIKQSFENIEILLVDDGSPDNSGVICDEYAQSDLRIKVIHKQNGGLSSARNAGVDVARGKWVMFVDGDDWIEPDMCETLYGLGERLGVQLVMCGMVKDNGRSSSVYKFYIEENKVFSKEECKWLQEQLLHFDGNIAVAYSKLIDRQLLQSNVIKHDEALKQGAEGVEFNLRLFEKLESAVFVNNPFYHYIYNDNSISASHNENNHELVVRCFEKIKEFILTSDNKENLLYWFNNRMLYVIITTAISGFFNPTNSEPYKDKKRKYSAYLNKTLIKEVLEANCIQGLSKQRKFTLFLIKNRMFRVLDIMGKVRKIQKDLR